MTELEIAAEHTKKELGQADDPEHSRLNPRNNRMAYRLEHLAPIADIRIHDGVNGAKYLFAKFREENGTVGEGMISQLQESK